MPHLQFYFENEPLFVHLLRPGRTLIGRSDRCDVALPSESVSRTHCAIEKKADAWHLVDRSRNGTFLNGERIQRATIQHKTEFTVGCYRVRFSEEKSLEGTDGTRGPNTSNSTTTFFSPETALCEEILEVSPQGIAATRVHLSVVRGPNENQTFEILQPMTHIGGINASICLHNDLPTNAGKIRVVRGRAMFEPGRQIAYLNGVRIRELTPIRDGEEIRMGEHGFVLHTRTESKQDSLHSFGQMIGESPPMRQLFGLLSRMASHDAVVLLGGESGTGKELASRAVHDASQRSGGPFVPVNCAGIPENLFESELFGHEKGAFTGASQRQDGAFHRADGGTLFLDEIGELRLDSQAKLLRALESGEVRRVGGQMPTCPDVRVIAATNRNLLEMVNDGSFRSDLYFRLAVLTVRMPPLRERSSDIPLIAEVLLKKQDPNARLTEEALTSLKRYPWPGNVRELRNVLIRAYVLGGPLVKPENLTFNPWAFKDDQENTSTPSPQQAEQQEKEAIHIALQKFGGNQSRAARELGIPRSSLIYKIQKYKLGKEG